MKNKFLCLVLTVSIAAVLTSCGWKKADSEASSENNTQIDTETESVTGNSAEQSNCLPQMQTVVDAIEGISNRNSFGISTEGHLALNGKAIKGDYSMKTLVHVSQQENHENMQMSMETSTDMDDIVTYTYYKDGWYYVDGTDGKQKSEKSPEEVLSLISGITDLVKNASEKIDSVDVKQEGSDTIYTYLLPDYLAENYLKNMVNTAHIEQLENAQVDIEEALFESTIGDDGLLKNQKVTITGTVHKMVFTVPTEAEISADFTAPDPEEPDIRTW